MTLPVYNQKADIVGQVELDPKIFELKIKPWIIQEAVIAQRAQKRTPVAHTKDRGEVRGGGKKPWKQKGTGRARHGSIRSPLWRGGGVTFGPRNDRIFAKKINKKVKNQAIRMILSEKAKNQNLKIVDAIHLQTIKTKEMRPLLKTLDVADKKTLISLDKNDKTVILATRNLRDVEVTAPDSLNVVNLLLADIVLATVPALHKIEVAFKP